MLQGQFMNIHALIVVNVSSAKLKRNLTLLANVVGWLVIKVYIKDDISVRFKRIFRGRRVKQKLIFSNNKLLWKFCTMIV